MIYFKRLFNFPGPKDLGMSDNNHAMASEMFRNNDTEFTWEMYYARIKHDYPVKYFFASTLPGAIRHAWWKLTNPISKAYWSVKYHVVPRHRYHMLKLSQPHSEISNIDNYDVGFRDIDTRILFAIFNLFNTFVAHEFSHMYFPSEEEAAKDDGIDLQYIGTKRQRERCQEILAIHQWWNVDRKVAAAQKDELLTRWCSMRTSKVYNRNGDTERAWQELQAAEKEFDDKEAEMIGRLMKIRKCLWT